MNSTYLKRELILNDIGIPLNEDVKKIINFFYTIIPTKKLKVKREYLFGKMGTKYFIEKKNIDFLFYYEEDKKLHILKKYTHGHFQRHFNLTYNETGEILKILLNRELNIEIKRVTHF